MGEGMGYDLRPGARLACLLFPSLPDLSRQSSGGGIVVSLGRWMAGSSPGHDDWRMAPPLVRC